MSLGESSLPLGGRPKVVPLLAYLLLHRGHALPRQAVANALWPDEAEEGARANLRRHLNYLHQQLPAGDVPWIIAERGRLQWNATSALWLDVAEFERLSSSPDTLQEAIALYTDDLLIDVDEEWLDAERERFKTTYHNALAALVARLRAARSYVAGIEAARALLAHDPWREDTLRALLALRYESGDRAGAVAEYERFAAALRDELDAEPMAETMAQYQAILRDDLQACAPPEPSAQRSGPGESSYTPFVGRTAELLRLRERWSDATAGNGGLVMIGGEAGIGKTRLVRELAVACESAGALVHSAATTFPETTPYQPFVALLRLAAPLAPSLDIDPVWLGAIAPLAPAVGENLPELPAPVPVDPARERLRLFEACGNVWSAIATRRPLLLIVEDVQWAGAATLALLEHLARRAQRARMLVVVTYREDELDLRHQLRAARRRLQTDGATLHVALARLSLAAVVDLVRGLADGDVEELARNLHARSEGNPFILEQILRDLTDSGRVRIIERKWSIGELPVVVVPAAVRDAVGARIARLDEPATTLAQAAAVIGRAFDVELLRETTGWTEATVLDVLDGLIERRIVGEHGARGSFDYAFTHHLVQAVVYDRIPEPARARRHRRVAHVMSLLYAESGDEVSAELALHWDRGGETERAATQYVRAARHAASVYGNDESEQYARRALELTGSDATRFDALLLRTRLAAVGADRAAQARTLDELVHIAARLGDEDAICTVLELRIELADVTGERSRERTLLGELEGRLTQAGDPRRRARLLECEARYCRGIGDFNGARDAFQELMRLAERDGDRSRYAAARLAFADAYIFEGRLREAHAALEELRSELQADGNQAAIVRTLMAFSRAALQQQDYAAMSEFAAEALEISRTIGDREGEALALHSIANGLVYTFRVADAESYYLRANELYEAMSHRVGLASISCDLGLFHTEIGLLERALAFYARARAIAIEIGFTWVVAVERIDVSYCRRLQGEYALARDCARDALKLARELPSQPLESAALGVLGAAESGLGAHADALAHLRAGVDLRRPSGATPRLGENLCALALASLRAGALDGARAAAGEMLALYDANPKLAPQPTEWLLTAAQIERAHGAEETAQNLLRQAVSVMRARAAAIDDATTRAAYLGLPFNVALATALTPAAT